MSEKPALYLLYDFDNCLGPENLLATLNRQKLPQLLASRWCYGQQELERLLRKSDAELLAGRYWELSLEFVHAVTLEVVRLS